MNYKLSGTIKSIGEKQGFESGFQKVQFVVTTNDEKYPQDVSFEIVQDKVDEFIKYNKVGASVDVTGEQERSVFRHIIETIDNGIEVGI